MLQEIAFLSLPCIKDNKTLRENVQYVHIKTAQSNSIYFEQFL